MNNYFKYNDKDIIKNGKKILKKYLKNYDPDIHNFLIILCIGTDRCTGDALGPLVGYLLRDMDYDNIRVFGALDFPVHAGNVNDIIEHLYDVYMNPFIIAIDASWCKDEEKVGYINIRQGGLNPGEALKKNIQQIGDITISGVTSTTISDDPETIYMVLSNVRLNLVMNMAESIASIIKQTLKTEHKKII